MKNKALHISLLFALLCFITLDANAQTKRKTSKAKAHPFTKAPAKRPKFATAMSNGSNGANVVVQFGVPHPGYDLCDPGSGICNTKNMGVSSTSGTTPTTAEMFCIDAGGNLDLMIHLDSLNTPGSSVYSPVTYDTLKKDLEEVYLSWAQQSGTKVASSSYLSTDICATLGITAAMSGLYDAKRGLLIPQHTYCSVTQPDATNDSEYIQIQFFGLFNTTQSNGNTVGLTLGSSACDNTSSGICSFSPLAPGVNTTLVTYDQPNSTLHLWFDYDNLVAAQPNMANYFTLINGIVMRGNLSQTETFVFTSAYSYINVVPTGLSIPPQTPVVNVSYNSNWIDVQHSNCYQQ